MYFGKKHAIGSFHLVLNVLPRNTKVIKQQKTTTNQTSNITIRHILVHISELRRQK